MARYAYFDSSLLLPSPVLGWYDTSFADYPNLPDETNLVILTDNQWVSHLINPGGWAVADGALVPASNPSLALPARAAHELAMCMDNGISITSTSSSALDAIYALDATSTAQIFQIGLYASQFSVFPSGGITQAYPDKSGIPHVFSIAQFIAFLRAVAPLVSALTTQAGVMASGGAPSWPEQTATII